MKVMKKISAWFIALAVLMSMLGVSAFAEEKKDETPKNDKATITVSNIEPGSTVNAYQIVKPVKDTNGKVTEYSPVLKDSIKDVSNPTAKEITALNAKIKSNSNGFEKATMSETGKTGTYTAEVNAGTWLIQVISKSSGKIYNPMIVSAAYDKSGKLKGNSISANEKSTLTEGKSYAKSSDITIDKVIDHSKDKFKSGNQYGTDAAIGDDVAFEINTVIPDFGPESDRPVFQITDALSEGLEFSSAFDVKVGEQKVDNKEYILQESKTNRKIMFVEKFIKENAGKQVKITYTAKLTEKAKVGFDLNTNTVTLEYSRSSCESIDRIKKINYVSTFVIDGELVKVDATNEECKKLEGAEFKLINNDTKKEYTTVTDKDGKLVFKGLDAGNYTLKETKAPKDYILDETEHNIKITAKYGKDGKLTEYTITTDNNTTATHKDNSKVIEEKNIYKIPNTPINKLPELPSTGGMGIYIFIIGGSGIMALSVVIYIFNNKKCIKK